METGGSDFGEEEEDVKPSIEYLNSLNEYRKRSRSTEDVGFPSSNSGKKVVKVGYDTPGTGPIIASTTPMLEALVREQPPDVEVPPLQAQGPIVYGTPSVPHGATNPSRLTCILLHSKRSACTVLRRHGTPSGIDDPRRIHNILRGISTTESVMCQRLLLVRPI